MPALPHLGDVRALGARTAAARTVALVLAVVVGLAGLAPAAAQNQAARPSSDCAPPGDDVAPEALGPRAGEHFVRGSQLYYDGQYEQAIVETKAAFCLKPHHDAAQQIALCYLALVDYEQAIAWFEEYIRILPEDRGKDRQSAQNRINRLRKLPARLSVSTEPAGARVRVEGPAGTIIFQGNAAEPTKLEAGTYRLHVELPGYEPIDTELALRIGQPYTYSYRLEERRGLLRVTTDPLSARIFIDNRLVAVGRFFDKLPVGQHEVVVEAEGRKPETRTVSVSSDRTEAVHVDLPAPPQSGRWEIVGASSLIGGLSGGALGGLVFDAGSSGSTIFTVGGLALGFAGAYFGAGERIPVGWTSTIIGGAVWGAGEGLALSWLFTNQDQGDTRASFAVAGMIGGTVASAIVARRLDLSAGDAAIVNSGGLWGTTISVILYSLFDLDDSDFGPFMLVGMNVGLLAGGAFAARTHYSRGHVALIDLAGVGGAVVGLALSQAALDNGTQSDDDDTKLHFTLAGTGLGLVIGGFLTRDMDEEAPERGFQAASLRLLLARDSDGQAVQLLGLGGTF